MLSSALVVGKRKAFLSVDVSVSTQGKCRSVSELEVEPKELVLSMLELLLASGP